ncbi:MAG: glycoside hydrolase family 3 C-terminal domain-containing protein [Spirochaetales bacterium]|nr:glycoside hydrolase family 3 C-terminal domain-containing protein [Spirochaetales bacterium]
MLKYKELIDKLTIAEKASLMSGKDFWQTKELAEQGIPSIFLADGPHGVRRQAVASDHLGLNEGIPATCFPTAATVANSWNEELGERVGVNLGKEAVSQRVNVLLGPGVNQKRNPLCGRNFEYFSEDPFLSGKMAAAYIRGIQSQGVAACIKHFAASNQEERIMAIDVVVDERSLREIYLTAFEIAIKEGHPSAVMTAYNKINGIYANENKHLLQDILRDEWGFDGCVITNWGGSNDRVAGLIAGNELEMPSTGGETDKDIIEAVKNGLLDEDILDQNVDRLLDLVICTEEALKTPHIDFNIELHHRVSQKVAEESIVLLKNEENILPLKYGRTVSVIGDFARDARYQGAGSSIVNPTVLDNTLECFDESGIKSIGWEPGFERYGKRNWTKIKKACKLAAESEVVLLYLGLDEVTEAQGVDRSDMSLPLNQIELLDALYEVNQNIIVILSCGAAIEMPWIDKARAVLHGYLGGQAGARAILRVLSGDVNPSGKLAETYPLSYSDTPSASNFPGHEVSVEYREALFVGYRYFDTVGKKVLFPFGFGLSYTSFEYSGLEIDDSGVSFFLKNSGRLAGMEVAQLYIACPDSGIFRPGKELKGFKKVFINPGETKKLRIPFDDKSFRYYNVKTGSWEIEPGRYKIMIGASSADIRLRGFLLKAGDETTIPYDKSALPSYYSGDISRVDTYEFETLLGQKAPDPFWDRARPLGYNDTIAQCRYAAGRFARVVYWLIIFFRWFLKKIGKRDSSNLIMMSIYNMPFRGISRMTGGLISMPMVDGILMVVNGHFFKGLSHFLKKKRELKKQTKTSKY